VNKAETLAIMRIGWMRALDLYKEKRVARMEIVAGQMN